MAALQPLTRTRRRDMRRIRSALEVEHSRGLAHSRRTRSHSAISEGQHACCCRRCTALAAVLAVQRCSLAHAFARPACRGTWWMQFAIQRLTMLSSSMLFNATWRVGYHVSYRQSGCKSTSAQKPRRSLDQAACSSQECVTAVQTALCLVLAFFRPLLSYRNCHIKRVSLHASLQLGFRHSRDFIPRHRFVSIYYDMLHAMQRQQSHVVRRLLLRDYR